MSARKKNLVSLSAAATYLDLSEKTVRRRIAEKKIKAYRVGRLIKIDLNDLEATLTPMN